MKCMVKYYKEMSFIRKSSKESKHLWTEREILSLSNWNA